MKNKMMRIASILLVAALITTCAISGTFAKYVTRVEGTDSARVAKWGVLLTVNADGTFADKYAAEDESYLEAGGEFSVESANGDKVVAPGTSSKLAKTQLKATVKGAPEVAARYILEAVVTDDVFLMAGEYTDYTELVLKTAQSSDEPAVPTNETPYRGETEPADAYGYFNTFELKETYAPVKWNMTITKGETTVDLVKVLYDELPGNLMAAAEAQGFSKDGCSIFAAVNILKKVAGGNYQSVIDEALGKVVSGGRNFQLEVDEENKKITLSYDFDPNKVMDFEFALDWAWAFENGEKLENGLYEFDAADTFLGNVAAGVVEAPEGCSVKIAAKLTATAVQID